MAITSLDILNLSHSLKDICEVNCNTPECLSQILKILMQYNLIQANLQFGRQFGQICTPPACTASPEAHAPGTRSVCKPFASATAQAPSSPANFAPAHGASPQHGFTTAPSPAQPCPAPGSAASPTTPIRLDIGDPFLADYEK